MRERERERGSGELREGLTLLDKNNDTAAGLRGIERKNARPGVSAIISQSRIFRDPERESELRLDSWIQIRFT